MKKNLIYFIYFNGEKNKYLEANLRLISRYLPIFNGQRIIKVAVDDLSQDLSIIKNLLPENTTFQVVKNDPENGESPHFIDSISQLSTDEDSITFYGHSKGVSREDAFSIKHWVSSLYFFNLEEHSRLKSINFLSRPGAMFSGIFQKICKTDTVKSDWHYSGTFFWFNTKNVVNKLDWDKIPMDRFMVEGFPGFMSGLRNSQALVYSDKRNYQLLSHGFWPRIIKQGGVNYQRIYEMAFGDKKCIYSVMIGDYDNLIPAPKFTGWDSILIIDQDLTDSKGWKIFKVDKLELSPEKESRRYKILSHKYLPEYDLVCYVDMNLKIRKAPPTKPTWFTHPKRVSVFQEADKVVELKKEHPEPVRAQIGFYKSQGFRDNYDLFQNGFFVRRHNDTQNKLHEYWWDQVEKYSYRDQLSLPFSIMKTGIKPENILPNRMINQYIYQLPHKNPFVAHSKMKVNVHHITPARSDKNFGHAINQLIERLPDHDWICLRDIDTFPPDHVSFIKQIEEIANNPGPYSLIGCMTNRLGLEYQLVPGMFNEFDVKKHKDIAKELSGKNTIKPLQGLQTVGGVLMLFSKRTWLRAGKFPEGGIVIKNKFVDYLFSRSVMKFGKLGIAEGVYLYHNYRIDAKETSTHTGHLR